jgi:hypothetical protein
MPTVSQLAERIDRGLPVPVDLYLETFFYENMNQNFGPCSICKCRTWSRGPELTREIQYLIQYLPST